MGRYRYFPAVSTVPMDPWDIPAVLAVQMHHLQKRYTRYMGMKAVNRTRSRKKRIYGVLEVGPKLMWTGRGLHREKVFEREE